MPTLQELKERYNRVETEVDAAGRVITVGLLKPAERYRVMELTDSQSPYVLMPMLQAAAVRKIIDPDGSELHFGVPNTREKLDAVTNCLDDEGMVAAAKAMTRLSPPKDDANGGAGGEAGNSRGTRSSASGASS